MNKKVLLIIGGVALGACLLCAGIIVVAGALGVGLTQPAATVGDAFMAALKSGDGFTEIARFETARAR